MWTKIKTVLLYMAIVCAILDICSIIYKVNCFQCEVEPFVQCSWRAFLSAKYAWYSLIAFAITVMCAKTKS